MTNTTTAPDTAQQDAPCPVVSGEPDTKPSEYSVTNEDFFGGLIIIALAVAMLALVVAIGGAKDIKVVLEMEGGPYGSDKRLRAVTSCIPYNATFEQELSCYQAVFRGGF